MGLGKRPAASSTDVAADQTILAQILAAAARLSNYRL